MDQKRGGGERADEGCLPRWDQRLAFRDFQASLPRIVAALKVLYYEVNRDLSARD